MCIIYIDIYVCVCVKGGEGVIVIYVFVWFSDDILVFGDWVLAPRWGIPISK